MNMRTASRRAAAAALAVTALAGLATQSMAAAAGAHAAAISTVVDYGGGHGRFAMQVRQTGSTIDVRSFSLACSSTTSVSVNPTVKRSRLN